MRARCELNYTVAGQPNLANNPIVVAALASAKECDAAFFAAVDEADAARGFGRWRAYRHVRETGMTADLAHAALRAAVESADREARQVELPEWMLDPRIHEKVMVATTLVIATSDSGLLFATKLLGDQMPSVCVDEVQGQRALAEIVAFLFSFIARRTDHVIEPDNGALFLREFMAGVATALQDKGVDRGFVFELITERLEEYAHYREWPEKGASPKGTAFHEFSKKVSTALHVGQNASFDAYFTNWILRTIHGWKLNELLSDH